MVKSQPVFLQNKTARFSVVVVIILLALLAVFFPPRYFFSSKINNYLIENKYYGFKLQTPKNWVAQEKTIYSEENINQLLTDCKNNKLNNAFVYEIGVFRFKDQRYPDDFGDLGYFPSGLSSGAILEIIVNCISDNLKNGIGSLPGDIKITGEEALEGFLDLAGFGRTKYFSLFHNSLQYRINEYVYVSSQDKVKDKEIRDDYTKAFSKIISSFEFTN